MKSLRWGPSLIGLVSLEEARPDPSLPLPLCAHSQRKATWGHSEKATFYKPESEIAPETNPHGTLVLDLHPPEMCKNKFLLFKQSSLWSFVTAPWADSYTCKIKIDLTREKCWATGGTPVPVWPIYRLLKLAFNLWLLLHRSSAQTLNARVLFRKLENNSNKKAHLQVPTPSVRDHSPSHSLTSGDPGSLPRPQFPW